MEANNSFKFNLLPKKSKEEIELIEERDNSLFYAVAIVLFATFIWLATTLFNTLIVQPRLNENQLALNSVQNQEQSYSIIKAKQGELVYKAARLKPLLERKIDTDSIFDVSAQLTEGIESAAIAGYGRERSGKFVFRVVTRRYEDVTSMMRNAEASLQESVTDLELRESTYDRDNDIVLTTIALNINGIANNI